MNELHEQLEMDAQDELLQEEFDPQRFFKALTNALVQLEHFQAAEAA